MSLHSIESPTSIILLIDDNIRAAENAKNFLTKASPTTGIEFIIAGPDEVGGTSEYLSLVDTLPASAVLIDQRLGESSSASYTGLELAGSLVYLEREDQVH